MNLSLSIFGGLFIGGASHAATRLLTRGMKCLCPLFSCSAYTCHHSQSSAHFICSPPALQWLTFERVFCLCEASASTAAAAAPATRYTRRSEEHTTELQSLMRISYAVFCLKKKNT